MSKADPKDYYAYLGVKPSATADQIRAAYHRCAKRCHPDVDPSPWAKARFQALNEAYRTLSNPSKRAAYDSLRPRSHAALEDFRRAPGLGPDDGWTKKTETVLGSERPQEAGPPAIAEARALVQEEAVPPPRPRALRSGLDDQAVSNLPPNGGDTAPRTAARRPCAAGRN